MTGPTENVDVAAVDEDYITDEELEGQIPDVEEGDEADRNEVFLQDHYNNINFDENYEDVEEDGETE